MQLHITKLVRAVVLLFMSLTVGMGGFMLIENYTLLNAFYMTVITISTVGFHEVVELSNGGKLFTAFYIIFNLGIFAYVVSILTTYLFEGELNTIFRNFMQGREVKQLKNHTIVCGYGRNGAKACEELAKEKKEFVLIEQKEEITHNFGDVRFQYITGDATLDEILKAAGIEKASAIITTLPADAENVFITLTARELNPDINIIARASDQNSEKKLFRAGATHVIMPDAIGGLHMAQLVTKPYVIEFLEQLNGVSDINVVVDEFSFDQFKEKFQQKSLKELDIRSETGVTVLGMKAKNAGFQFNPHPTTIIGRGDVLIILGTVESIKNFKKRFS